VACGGGSVTELDAVCIAMLTKKLSVFASRHIRPYRLSLGASLELPPS